MPHDSLDNLLAKCGATLVRRSRHLIYSILGHGLFTTSVTPSDARARKNALALLRRMLASGGQGVAAPVGTDAGTEPAAVMSSPVPPPSLSRSHSPAPRRRPSHPRRSPVRSLDWERPQYRSRTDTEALERLRNTLPPNVSGGRLDI